MNRTHFASKAQKPQFLPGAFARDASCFTLTPAGCGGTMAAVFGAKKEIPG